MRGIWLAAMILAVVAFPRPLSALEAGDTMVAWKGAGAAEKSKLVGEMLKASGDGSASGVVKCVDAASEVSGHADLLIRLVVEACAKQAGEPV